MNNKTIITSATSLLLLLVASITQAEVAQITSINGQAVVERASYKYHAEYGMVLEEGDILRILKGKVFLQYTNCISQISTAHEVTISKTQPCAVAKKAKPADLVALKTKKFRIEHLNRNQAAKCNACKINMAHRKAATASNFDSLSKAIIGNILFAALTNNHSNKSGDSISNSGASSGNIGGELSSGCISESTGSGGIHEGASFSSDTSYGGISEGTNSSSSSSSGSSSGGINEGAGSSSTNEDTGSIDTSHFGEGNSDTPISPL